MRDETTCSRRQPISSPRGRARRPVARTRSPRPQRRAVRDRMRRRDRNGGDRSIDALQQAERSYHRTIAGSAFASPTEGPSALELQKESLDAVEAARVRLDEIRTRKP